MAFDEIKSLVEKGNRAIEAIQAEVDKVKSADVVTDEKVARMETDLAAAVKQAQDADLARKALETRLAEVETKANRPAGAAQAEQASEHKAALFDWMRNGEAGGAGARLHDLGRKATDVQVATPASGGYALPKEIATEIARVATDISPIRQIARVVTVGTTDYHELVDLGGAGYEWVNETADRNQTNTPDLADVVPTFGEISAKPEATRTSISDLFFDVESWLVDAVSERFAAGEGLAFVSGNGTNKPTGFLTGTPVATGDAARAFGVLQYVPSGAAGAFGTAPGDNLKDLTFTAKAQYRGMGRFVMNSLTFAQLAKVKDSNGAYLLQERLSEADPLRLTGFGVTLAEDMPNVAANAFPIAFGDFTKGYLIADIPGMWMVRDELTKTGWVRFPMARRVGGKLKDTNAIKLLKIATS